jgi:pimeloyl-ACP methyl ester carboxylesterase
MNTCKNTNEFEGIKAMAHSRFLKNYATRGSACALALLLGATGAPATSAAPKTITVGTLTLKLCDETFNGYCGSIKRVFDPTGGVKGDIDVAFVYYPRFDQTRPGLGTLLPQEGGPGYSTRGTTSAYLNIYGSLRDRRDVLIIDKRGTGLSDAVNCHAIQTGDPTDPAGLKACGQRLGKKAPLYGTKLAVDDIVAVMDAMQIDDVDYYGDSYGTYVGQVFAAWHPDRLRSIILDSAYPVRAPDVWFPTDWITGREGLDLVCERSPPCRALGGTSTNRLEQLLRELRQHSISGRAPDADGTETEVTLDVPMLFLLVTSLGSSPITYRDLDSATRAWFDSHDAVPLLRLAAEYNTPSLSDPVDFSEGLYQAVVCAEYPLLYDLSASPSQRRQQYARSLENARENRPDLFAPFTIDEAIASNADSTPLGTCLDWPVPPPAYPQGDPLPAHPVFPTVPTLVLSGDLDSVTSPEDGNQAAAQFPNVVHLLIPNLTHVTAYYYSDVGYLPDGGDTTHCVEDIVRRFISQLSPGDTSCTRNVRPLRTPPRFARTVSELSPVHALSGNQASTRELKSAAGALETVGDVFARFIITYGIGSGLRGGQFTYFQQSYGYEFDLDHVQWTKDLQVTGTIRWHTASGDVSADVELLQNGKNVGHLNFAWNDVDVNAIASITGSINGARVKAKRIAP